MVGFRGCVFCMAGQFWANPTILVPAGFDVPASGQELQSDCRGGPRAPAGALNEPVLSSQANELLASI